MPPHFFIPLPNPSMPDTDKKLLKIFTKQGHQFDLLTRMERSAIEAALEQPSGVGLAEIYAIDGANDAVTARVDPADISAYFIMKPADKARISR